MQEGKISSDKKPIIALLLTCVAILFAGKAVFEMTGLDWISSKPSQSMIISGAIYTAFGLGVSLVLFVICSFIQKQFGTPKSLWGRLLIPIAPLIVCFFGWFTIDHLESRFKPSMRELEEQISEGLLKSKISLEITGKINCKATWVIDYSNSISKKNIDFVRLLAPKGTVTNYSESFESSPEAKRFCEYALRAMKSAGEKPADWNLRIHPDLVTVIDEEEQIVHACLALGQKERTCTYKDSKATIRILPSGCYEKEAQNSFSKKQSTNCKAGEKQLLESAVATIEGPLGEELGDKSMYTIKLASEDLKHEKFSTSVGSIGASYPDQPSNTRSFFWQLVALSFLWFFVQSLVYGRDKLRYW
jgi:hypothetical protein